MLSEKNGMDLKPIKTTVVELSFSLDKGGCELSVSAKRLSEQAPSAGDLKAALKPLKLRAPIPDKRYQQLAEALRNSELVEDMLLARGIAPREGQAGFIVPLVKAYEGILTRNAAEYADFRFTKHFDNIKPGIVVARVYPPKKGGAGFDVFGKRIAAADSPEAAFQIDNSIRTEEREGYTALIAEKAGYLEVLNSRYSIKDILVLDEINLRTGDIDFVGAVHVKGDVLSGASLRAKKDIEVGGTFEGVRLESTEGGVSIQGGVRGPETRTISAASLGSAIVASLGESRSCTVIAEKSVNATFVQRAHVYSKESIQIKSESRHAELSSDGPLVAEDAVVVGGVVRTCSGGTIKSVGSKSGTKTTLELCCDLESWSEFKTLAEELEQLTHLNEMYMLYLGPYSEKDLDPAEFSARAAGSQLAEIKASYQLTKKRLGELEKMIAEYQRAGPGCKPEGFEIRKRLFNGVQIIAGDELLTLSEDVAGPLKIRLSEVKNEIELETNGSTK